jgi:hypothetical protein
MIADQSEKGFIFSMRSKVRGFDGIYSKEFSLSQQGTLDLNDRFRHPSFPKNLSDIGRS